MLIFAPFSVNANVVPSFGGTAPSPLSFKGEGGMAGLQAGYNYQFGAGLEALNLITAGREFKVMEQPISCCLPAALGANSNANLVSAQKVDSLATIRGRLGWLPSEQRPTDMLTVICVWAREIETWL